MKIGTSEFIAVAALTAVAGEALAFVGEEIEGDEEQPIAVVVDEVARMVDLD